MSVLLGQAGLAQSLQPGQIVEKAAKAATATDLWVPAVNNHGRLGRWSFLEVTDPWDAANLIRAHVRSLAPAGISR